MAVCLVFLMAVCLNGTAGGWEGVELGLQMAVSSVEGCV